MLNDEGKLEGKLHLEVKDSVRPVQLPPRLALKPKVKDERCTSIGEVVNKSVITI